MQDPLSDFLNTLKMASRTGKEAFVFPSSRLLIAIAEVLVKKGYLASFRKAKKGHNLEIKLPIGEQGKKVNAARRVSRLSQRLYRKTREIRPVRNGSGTAILSTPKGLMSDTDARAGKVGGEVLFEIW